MRTELVNCQGSHLREPMQTDPLSVNVHLLRRMRQLRLAVLQGHKKGKCVFFSPKRTLCSIFLFWVLIVMLASDTYKRVTWR